MFFGKKSLEYRKINYFCLENVKPLNTYKMNKVELISAIAEKAGMTKVDAKKALDAMVEVAKTELKNDGKITLVGFGTLGVSERPGRKGHNPKTGEIIDIPAKKVVKFKPATDLI